MQKECAVLGYSGGPLYRVVYPTPKQLKIRTNHEVPDFVAEHSNMPLGLENVLIHKYRR